MLKVNINLLEINHNLIKSKDAATDGFYLHTSINPHRIIHFLQKQNVQLMAKTFANQSCLNFFEFIKLFLDSF